MAALRRSLGLGVVEGSLTLAADAMIVEVRGLEMEADRSCMSEVKSECLSTTVTPSQIISPDHDRSMLGKEIEQWQSGRRKIGNSR